jgi:hypothetical protein
MKKLSAIAILVVIVSVLMGCSPEVTNTVTSSPAVSPVAPGTVTRTTAPVTAVKTAATTTKTVYGDITIDDFTPNTWGLYGSLTFNNYRTGFDTSTRDFPPIYIINRLNRVTDTGVLTTYADETTADIPLHQALYNNDVSSVTIKSLNVITDGNGKSRILTTATGENLVAEKYQNGLLTISGLLPDKRRGLQVSYAPDLRFSVTCIFNSEPDEGYVAAPADVLKWVSFDRDNYSASPDSAVPIYVYLNIPEGETLPDKWEFWVEVTTVTERATSGISTEAAYRTPIMVNMAVIG